MPFVSDRGDDIAEDHDDDIGNHCRESHFRFSDTTISSGCFCRDPIAEGSSRDESDQSTDEDREIEEACTSQCLSFTAVHWKLTDGLGAHIVWGSCKYLRLREVQNQEVTATPADHEGSKEYNGIDEESPWGPDIEKDVLKGC